MVLTVEARRLYEERKGLAWALAIALPIAVVVVGALVAPDLFVDRFLWQDLWGPLWADAHQCGSTASCGATAPNPGGVTAKEGYTITSELVYGIVLAAALYGIWNGILKRYRVKMDGWWVASLLPFILLGPTARTLEDANAFIGEGGEPGVFAYLFISPIIYMHVAVYTVAALAIGVLVSRAAPHADRNLLVGAIAAVAATGALLYAFVGASYASGFGAFAPWWVYAIAAAAGVAFFAWRVSKGAAAATVNATLFSLGLPLIAPPLWLIATWLSGSIWSEEAWNQALFPLAGLAMIAFALAAVAVVALLAFALSRRLQGRARDGVLLYLGGLNLALVFGHALDAFATWIALLDPLRMDLPSYAEKHPFSDFLLQIGAGTPFAGLGFPVAKLTMIVIVIWILDREFKEESAGDRELVGLIKMAIFVLGFAPGLRDLLRVTMGV